MSHNRVSIKFAGESGQGVNSSGELLATSLNNLGFKIFAYREYPSLIKGGVASYQIDFSNRPLNSSKKECNILICFSEESLIEYLPSISNDGIVIYDTKEKTISEELEKEIKKKNIDIILLDSEKMSIDVGGTPIMANAVLLGFLWKVLKFDQDTLVETILEFFKEKNIDFKAEKRCILAGYNSPSYRPEVSKKITIPKAGILKQKSLVLAGNAALALGAISAGVRAYYAYPMTPATSIFKYLSMLSKDTGMLVKQAENEITAIHMALGSMYMGTRALVGTSGGGFDLMLETLTCSGISETPLVVILSQRTGAATGIPTWTGAGDLNTALRGGHGEFPRCVIAASDASSSYTTIQKALNTSEQYQTPVVLLTEKQISESLYSINTLPKDIPIQRGLEDGENRYQVTDSGISPRWIPSRNKKTYLSNSDEHLEDGSSTERSEDVIQMSEKRMRKMTQLKKSIPEPELFGSKNSKTVFVGWGSSKGPLEDMINSGEDISYLHYEYLFPLKTKTLLDLISKGKRIILIENNQTGQLGSLIKEEIGYEFKEKLLKYDGRPFFFEDILDFLRK